MPRKIRELIAMLNKAGFVDSGGKGSHRNFLHHRGVRVTLAGAPSDDALRYQEKEVVKAIEVANNESE
jgi:predicted RNA binding protein YcfA (HicA-like mRNA interferase family)